MAESRYRKHLPDIVLDCREFLAADRVESGILEEAARAKDEMIADQWILTATRRGLERRANMIGLLGSWADLEEMRQAVLYQWNIRSPYTYRHLIEWLDGYCGKEFYLATLTEKEYRFRIILELQIKEKAAYLRQRLREILPANIITEVLLNTNTHRKIGAVRHGRLMERSVSYGELPFEELRNYEEHV